ncbi:hypothetical protein ABTN71_19645 [Acinetobacter baumannii]
MKVIYVIGTVIVFVYVMYLLFGILIKKLEGAPVEDIDPSYKPMKDAAFDDALTSELVKSQRNDE